MKKINFFIISVIFISILISFEAKATENVPVPPPVPATSTPSGPVFQRLSLEIKDLKLSKDPASYNTGDKIEGSFKLKNNTNFFRFHKVFLVQKIVLLRHLVHLCYPYLFCAQGNL